MKPRRVASSAAARRRRWPMRHNARRRCCSRIAMASCRWRRAAGVSGCRVSMPPRHGPRCITGGGSLQAQLALIRTRTPSRNGIRITSSACARTRTARFPRWRRGLGGDQRAAAAPTPAGNTVPPSSRTCAHQLPPPADRGEDGGVRRTAGRARSRGILRTTSSMAVSPQDPAKLRRQRRCRSRRGAAGLAMLAVDPGPRSLSAPKPSAAQRHVAWPSLKALQQIAGSTAALYCARCYLASTPDERAL